ncbi:MAG TPA: hypothetical protein VKJ07_11575, partial [Mycobacteriales bacterium]|nr:hypothetical protein [Mycobacteriales bacterium]
LSQAYDTRWHAGAGGRTLSHVRTFGWANGWQVDRPATIRFRFAGQLSRNVWIVVQALLWLGLVGVWWTIRRRLSRADPTAADVSASEPVEPVPA